VQYQPSGSGVNTSIVTDVDGVMQRLKAFPRAMRECRNGGVNTPKLGAGGGMLPSARDRDDDTRLRAARVGKRAPSGPPCS
jgi:hypothetical protein